MSGGPLLLTSCLRERERDNGGFMKRVWAVVFCSLIVSARSLRIHVNDDGSE